MTLSNNNDEDDNNRISPFSYTLDELSHIVQGKGRAQAFWDCLRFGVDPIWYYYAYDYDYRGKENDDDDDDDREPIGFIPFTTISSSNSNSTSTTPTTGLPKQGWTRKEIQTLLHNHHHRRQHNGLGQAAHQLFQDKFCKTSTSKSTSSITAKMNDNMADGVASLVKVSQCQDNTTKLLLKLAHSEFYIETVIIPWNQRQRQQQQQQQQRSNDDSKSNSNRSGGGGGSSTLCISSQVGCRQACTFCSTGRMGKLRDLTMDEILIQVYWAMKISRIYLNNLYPIDNIVFMGMGEPADNSIAVMGATKQLIDPYLFQLAPRRITISTVAPTPQSFQALLLLPPSKSANDNDNNNNNVNQQQQYASINLAWSVHSSREDIRRQLVPTTKYTMVELREGLIQTLLQLQHEQEQPQIFNCNNRNNTTNSSSNTNMSIQRRPCRLPAIMLEITLLNQINDSTEDAMHLVTFCQPLLTRTKLKKLVVNLIPWNDIGASFGPAARYQTPTMERVLAFQNVLRNHDILCFIRTTRGTEENAACGMLATKTTTTTTTTSTKTKTKPTNR